MARKAPTPCRGIGCPALVSKPGFCPKCDPGDLSKGARGGLSKRTPVEGQEGQQSRSGSRRAIYGSVRWRKLSRSFRARNPLCALCEEAGEITPATCVDHIEEIQDRPDLQWSLANLQSLCDACHARKTMLARSARKARNGPPGPAQ